MKLKIFIPLLLIWITKVKAQDTIKYVEIIGDALLYESFELYPDSTFKWTSEYDLTFSEYGKYKINDKILELNYYTGSKNIHSKPTRIERYIIEHDKLVILKNSKKIKRRKDPSLRKGLGWLFGHKYIIRKIS